MSSPEKITCFHVTENNPISDSRKQARKTSAQLRELSIGELPNVSDDEVTIAVRYSALNYKDGLAANGHPGVALALPLVPGIDAVGTVLESKTTRFQAGQTVMVSGADFGTKCWGGWSTVARAPADYCFEVPKGLSDRESVILGTAGFTAAQSVEKLQHGGVHAGDGPIAVTGATGGVGVFAVCLLAKLGYEVVAVTGKADRADDLRSLGVSDVWSREQMNDESNRPLLSGKFAGGIDTVGGNPLGTLLRSTRRGGCVTACGLVAGNELSMTVYPFILRGVSLQGIDSANAPVEYRAQLWNRLATEWKLDGLEKLAQDVSLQTVQTSVDTIMKGGVFGRHVVVVS